jgi:hypothetical protein
MNAVNSSAGTPDPQLSVGVLVKIRSKDFCEKVRKRTWIIQTAGAKTEGCSKEHRPKSDGEPPGKTYAESGCGSVRWRGLIVRSAHDDSGLAPMRCEGNGSRRPPGRRCIPDPVARATCCPGSRGVIPREQEARVCSSARVCRQVPPFLSLRDPEWDGRSPSLQDGLRLTPLRRS